MWSIIGVAERFIGLNTEDRLAMLRKAWLNAPAGGNTLLAQIQEYANSASDYEDEDLNSSSSNSHTASSQQPGAATAAAAEKTRGWNQMIEAFQTVRFFLRQCCKYGYDAFTVQANGNFPPGPVIADVNSRVIVDSDGNWDLLCDKYGDDYVNVGLVVGKIVDDGAVYLWLLNNPQLLSITRGVTEQRGDYTEAIIGRSGGRYYA